MNRKTEYTIEELVSVAKEINSKVEGLAPKIVVTKRKVEELELDIEKVSVDIIEPEDKFTLFATKVIVDLGGKPFTKRLKPDSKPVLNTRGSPKTRGPGNGGMQKLIAYWTPLISGGKYTRKELLSRAKEKFSEELSRNTIHTMFSRGVTGHPMSRFKAQIVIDPITKLVTFKK